MCSFSPQLIQGTLYLQTSDKRVYYLEPQEGIVPHVGPSRLDSDIPDKVPSGDSGLSNDEPVENIAARARRKKKVQRLKV